MSQRIGKDGQGKTSSEIASETKVDELVEELVKYQDQALQNFRIYV